MYYVRTSLFVKNVLAYESLQEVFDKGSSLALFLTLECEGEGGLGNGQVDLHEEEMERRHLWSQEVLHITVFPRMLTDITKTGQEK